VPSSRRRLVVLAPAIALAMWAAFQVAHATRHDLSATPDSASYLGTADNIRHGRGPTVPFTFLWDDYSPDEAVRHRAHIWSSHFPPAYPASLAVASVVAGDSRDAARVVDIICVALNVVLVALLTARMTKYRSAIVATITPAVMLFVTDAVPVPLGGVGWFGSHIAIASEPLFAVLFTATLIVTGTAITAEGRRADLALVGAAALAAMALLTRYNGVAAVITAVISLVWFDGARRLPERLRRSTIFAAAATAPIVVFVLIVAANGGGGARVFAYHNLGDVTRGSLRLIGSSLAPVSWPEAAHIASTLVLVAVTVIAATWLPRVEGFWRHDREGTVLLRCCVLSIPIYIFVIWFARTFLDRGVNVAPRYFVGLRGIWTAVFVAALYRVVSTYVAPLAVAVVLAIAVVLVAHSDWSYTRFWWRTIAPRTTSAVERTIAALPRETLLATSVPERVYLTTARSSVLLPSRVVYLTGKTNHAYAEQVDEFVELLRTRGGYLLWVPPFDPIVTPDELGRRLPLRIVAQGGDETLYRVTPAP
jgi:4-amino-4-deoxy-L-arabinose transferase-like glycosyltransferase